LLWYPQASPSSSRLRASRLPHKTPPRFSHHAGRRHFLSRALGQTLTLSLPLAVQILTVEAGQAVAASSVPAEPQQLSPEDIENIRGAFRAFDEKKLDEALLRFTQGLARLRELGRSRDEQVAILKAKGNVLVDLKRFDDALKDYNEAIEMMRSDGETAEGTARYLEYPDTFISRGLTKEGLSDWKGAIEDYDKAIKLWGGGRGPGVNPYVLVYRGNAYTKLGNWKAALEDYEAARSIFLETENTERASDARANYALALYQVGDKDRAVSIMKQVLITVPGYTDMHVALAADHYSKGEMEQAVARWTFACTKIKSGCDKYRRLEWVEEVRRWPPALLEPLGKFLRDEKVGADEIAKQGFFLGAEEPAGKAGAQRR